jgi:NADPH-dependent 2,4-dienoyl-CoA reductase/sulfur reductase-like enzyme
MESIFRKGRVECLVNPALGREKEMEFTPASPPKKVMVIGGGPGGLNVAWVSAKRGHDVHLYEKQSTLGGQLILGSITSYKKELLSLIDFQKTQMEKFGVRCTMNVEVTLDTIKEENPDVVILATGSSPVTPPVPGIDKPIVSTFIEVFNGDKPAKRKTVVVGGGATGCEVALHLSENGCPVTIVEQLPKIGGQLESITKKVLISRMKENGIQSMPGHRLSKVEDNGVLVTDQEGNEVFIEAESVVVSIGNKPDKSLYDEIKGLGTELYQIGDCLEPRSAKAAIYEGAIIGRAI